MNHCAHAVFHRRRRVVAGVSLAGAGLLGVSLSTRPDSPEFYGLTLGIAGTWVAGGLLSGPLHLGWMPSGRTTSGRWWFRSCSGSRRSAPSTAPRWSPGTSRCCAARSNSVLQYAVEGTGPLVLLTTLANGAAEEVFFRGALFAAVGPRYPVAKFTAMYALATTATRNPALVLASAAVAPCSRCSAGPPVASRRRY